MVDEARDDARETLPFNLPVRLTEGQRRILEFIKAKRLDEHEALRRLSLPVVTRDDGLGPFRPALTWPGSSVPRFASRLRRAISLTLARVPKRPGRPG